MTGFCPSPLGAITLLKAPGDVDQAMLSPQFLGFSLLSAAAQRPWASRGQPRSPRQTGRVRRGARPPTGSGPVPLAHQTSGSLGVDFTVAAAGLRSLPSGEAVESFARCCPQRGKGRKRLAPSPTCCAPGPGLTLRPRGA